MLLIALGATSFDAAIRRLGPRWTTLHRAAYVIAVLAIVHFLMQKKLEIYEPTLMAGLALWLFGYRILNRFAGAPGWRGLTLLAAASAFLTAVLEALWFGVKTGVDPWRVLEANLTPDIEIRPALWVFAITLGVAAVKFIVDFRPSARRSSVAVDATRA